MGNSVIYRPAYDAEVEYLESTGKQWIDTGVKPDSTYTFDCKVAFTSAIDGSYVPWGCRDYRNTIIAQCFLFVSNMSSHDGEKIRLITTNSWTDSENWNSGIVPIPNTMYELVGMTSVSNMGALNSDIAIFGFITNGVNISGLSRCRIGYWKCYSNGVLVRDMIPVRIGQIGYLYDKVSKQLFANKGTGQFILGNDVSNAVIPQQRCVLYFGSQRSVGFERIYEEYEWLKGDGTARISTNETISSTDKVECVIKPTDTIETSNRWQYIYCNNGGDNDFTFMFVLDHPTSMYFRHYRAVSVYTPNDIYTIEHSINSVSVNGIQLGHISENQYVETDRKLGLFCAGDNPYVETTHIYTGYIGEFKLIDKLNLTPCRLLRPIPAILDGNGIARQAGECGMWDKVSNRFYGNVASSGTFTVKGPKCYEEYKWLIIPYTQNNANALPIKSNNFSYQYIIYSVGNIAGLWTANTKYAYYPNLTKCSIWGQSELIVVHSNSNWIPLATPFDVECNSDGITMNGELMPNYGSSPYFDRLAIYCYTSTGKYALSKITVDGSVRYVPCKLTNGIPASMDANGRARPAGTCGMWDKVNDKFYGNVASSGTFTVSND